MFNTGTRVIVLDSSFSGKTGPKKGSIGYALRLNPSGYGNYFDSKRSWFATLNRVFFVRYGFEEKRRNESKFFINLFPYPTRDEVMALQSTPDLIDAKLNDVFGFDSKGKEPYNQVKYSVTSKFGKKHVHTGILVPTPDSFDSLIKSEPHDFAAWVECFMKSRPFYNTLRRMINNFGKLAGVFDPADLVKLKQLSDIKNERESYLEMASSMSDVREKLVETIQKVRTIGERLTHIRVRKEHRGWLKAHTIGGSWPRELMAMRMLLNEIYNRLGAEDLELIYEKNKNYDYIREKVEYMFKITKRLVSLARTLEGGDESKVNIANE